MAFCAFHETGGGVCPGYSVFSSSLLNPVLDKKNENIAALEKSRERERQRDR
jgi:hypothetical protein